MFNNKSGAQMLSQNINWSPWAIIVLMLGLSGCTTSYDPLHPRTYRQVSGGYPAAPSCGGYQRGCCGAPSNCGAPYAAPYAPYRRAAYRDRYSIQPYPNPAYGRPNPGYGRPGYGRPYYPRYGGRYGGSVRVAGPYGAASRGAYYGPYGSVHTGRSARFY